MTVARRFNAGTGDWTTFVDPGDSARRGCAIVDGGSATCAWVFNCRRPGRANQLLASRLRFVQRQSVGCARTLGIHSQSGRAPENRKLPRRISSSFEKVQSFRVTPGTCASNRPALPGRRTQGEEIRWRCHRLRWPSPSGLQCCRAAMPLSALEAPTAQLLPAGGGIGRKCPNPSFGD